MTGQPFQEITHSVINDIIKREKQVDINLISDGYHTFGELYDHRIQLFITLCSLLDEEHEVWRSKVHSDGTSLDGWFLLGIESKGGKQITYHLPISRWEECERFAYTYEVAPEFDGHTSADVLERLKSL